ncbi:MAG: hypothetical protein IGS48_04130 [Oscillatoriales cyanobacterium C42_A2020_001]|nr:hypothetical protein [Leptolyngbyaceae cyanobacterium C42_A2020_001]
MRISRNPFQSSSWQRLTVYFALFILVGLLVHRVPVNAQLKLIGNEVDGFPVVLDGKEVFRVRYGIPEGISAEERAQVISQRLQAIASDSSLKVDTSQPVTERSISFTAPSRVDKGVTLIGANLEEAGVVNDKLIVTVRDQDAVKLNIPREQFAQDIAIAIDNAVSQYKLKQQRKRNAFMIVGGLLFLLLISLILLKLFNRFFKPRNTQQPQWLNSNRWLQWGLIPLTLLGFLALSMMGLMLENTELSNFVNSTIQQFQSLLESLIQYLPNLVILTVIACLAWLAIALVKLVITELGKDSRAAWFDQEWISPTVSLATILISAVGCAIALPYLPGFGSPTFLIVMVVLGILFVLSSYSIVANAIAGFVLIYSSNWSGLKDDQEVALSNPMGQLITAGRLKKSLFISQLILPGGQHIFVPNSSLLNSYITLQSPPSNGG